MEATELQDRIKRLKRYKSRLDEMCNELGEMKQWFSDSEVPEAVDGYTLDSVIFGATLDIEDAVFEVEEWLKHCQRLVAQ